MIQPLFVAATILQIVAVTYCILLLRKHWNAASAWACLLGALGSMLVWRIVMTTGVTPGAVFNTAIAIWGSVCAVLAMFFFEREITRREHAEAERDRLLASERAARSEAEQASRIKDEFLATLSHELRTPLAAILGWCSILRASRQRMADVERAATVIERNARMQAHLVDDLLDATRMQAGSLHLELEPLALDGPVTAAIEAVRPSAEAKQITLEFSPGQPAPVVIGDASRLQQVASNLLVNAIKFTPEGRRVHVSLGTAGAHAVLSVADEGVGIDPDFMPHLFQRFKQADGTSTRRHGGLGLGLSIAASLVQLHQGEIRAESAGLDRGSVFTVRLPLAPSAPDSAAGRTQSVARPDASATLDGLRILVVDDEADVREAVTSLLEQAGAAVRALDSGTGMEGALREFRPDVLLLDIGMPGEDGYALIRRVRQLPADAGGQTPAISLTAHARAEDRRHAIDSGFQAHLAKPVNVPQLVASIRGLVGTAAVPGPVA